MIVAMTDFSWTIKNHIPKGSPPVNTTGHSLPLAGDPEPLGDHRVAYPLADRARRSQKRCKDRTG